MTDRCSYLLAVLILIVNRGLSGTMSHFMAGWSERPSTVIADGKRGGMPWHATHLPLALRGQELRCSVSVSQPRWRAEPCLGGCSSEDDACDVSLETSLWLIARLRGGELKPKCEASGKMLDTSVKERRGWTTDTAEEVEMPPSTGLWRRRTVATNGPRSYALNAAEMVPADTNAQDTTTTEFVSQCLLPTPRGRFRLRAYRHKGNGRSLEPVVLVAGDIGLGEGVPVRVHDQCLTSEVLGSMRCDCMQQLEMAMDYISQHGGCVIYLQQEGRGIGLANKVAAYELQDGGLDTVDANRHLGFHDDLRSYEAVKYILGDMGITSIKLMTNNPFKLESLKAMGIKILSRIPMLVAPNAHSLPYLETKARRMSHQLHQIDDVKVMAESLEDDSTSAVALQLDEVGVIRGGEKASEQLPHHDHQEQCDQCEEQLEGEEEGYAFGKDSVLAAIEAVREGKCVVVTDDEDRENEGDLIFAAEKATEDLLAFMIRHTSGVICASLEEDRLKMVANNEDAKRTAFTVTVDAKLGTSTGISAGDRAITLRALSDSKATANDFSRPGHIFPLRYTDGGVLTRAGHTEAAVDLAKLAGLRPVGVLCEITTKDGRNMARMPDLRQFCAEHGLVLTSIQDEIPVLQVPCRSTMRTIVEITMVSFCIRVMHAQARQMKPHLALLHADIATVKGERRPTTRASSTKYDLDAGRAIAGDRAIAGVQLSKSGLSPDLQWITDPWDRGVLFSVKVDAVVHDVRSKFQHVQVLQTPAMGRMLVLDSALQCAERDEAGYHEFMAHVALCRRGGKSAGSGPGKSGKRALIIGGGDGGVAREILRHDDVATVDLVDIDAEVMAASKKFLPGVWRHPNSTDEAYVPLDEDKRLTVRAEDGLAYLAADDGEGYDLIVVDASDPVGPGAALYSDDFYALLRRRLRPRGAVAVQGGSFWYLPMVLRTVYHGLKKAFPMVRALQCFTAVYPGGLWNVQIATLGDDPQEVDLAKAETLCRSNHLLFYSPQAHRAAFALPPVALQELAKPPPSLRDTTSDLEEIMAFGEESDGTGRQEVALSQRWEPDVRRSLSRLVNGVSSAANAPLAAFDADGTLWDGDAAEIFMEWMKKGNRWNHRGDFLQRYHSMVTEGDKKGAYGYVGQLFEGMEVKEARRLARENFKLNVEHLLIPEMEELVKHLHARGWRVVIVSASPKWIIEPGALRLDLGRDDVLGIEVETVKGKATSALRLPLPVLEDKVDALKTIFKERPALAVGNSLDDSAMLSYARGLALVSNPSCQEVEVLARENGWSIHHLNNR